MGFGLKFLQAANSIIILNSIRLLMGNGHHSCIGCPSQYPKFFKSICNKNIAIKVLFTLTSTQIKFCCRYHVNIDDKDHLHRPGHYLPSNATMANIKLHTSRFHRSRGGSVVKVADWYPASHIYPYESLVAAGRASSQNCSCAPVKDLPWYRETWQACSLNTGVNDVKFSWTQADFML